MVFIIFLAWVLLEIRQRSSYGGLVSDAWDVQNLSNGQNRTLILLGTSLNVVLKGESYRLYLKGQLLL